MPCRSITSTKKTATGKQLYAVALADRGLRALAGLWENWRSPAGEWMPSFAINVKNNDPTVVEPVALNA
jgi:putative SOS response-associated peptidase YedK